MSSSDGHCSKLSHGKPTSTENSIHASSAAKNVIQKHSRLNDASLSSLSYSISSNASRAHVEDHVMAQQVSGTQSTLQQRTRRSSLDPVRSSLHQFSFRPRNPSKESYISTSSVPTHEDLYEGRRHRLHNYQRNLHTEAREDQKQANSEATSSQSHSLQLHPGNEEGVAIAREDITVAKSAPDIMEDMNLKEDALLKRMRRKEKEFDAKIKQINQTFSNAGRQLVIRDDIINALHREIFELREQIDKKNSGSRKSREEEARLMQSTQSNTNKLQIEKSNWERENEHLRTKLDEYKSCCASQQAEIRQLREELEASDKASRECKRHHAKQVEKLRKHFQRKLCEISKHYTRVERERADLQGKIHQAEQQGRHAEAKVLQAQLEISRQRDKQEQAMKCLFGEQSRLQEEAEAAWLSMARLLSVLSFVPSMREYLKWNEINSEFVFVGYPTQYFSLKKKNPGEAIKNAISPTHRASSCPTAYDDADVFDQGSEIDSAQSSDLEVKPDTGVENGIYTGSTSFEATKNIWLNGQWSKHMREIVDAENIFTRLRKIKLLELEEAAKVCNQLPTAQDVLQCRQHERDYWVPYEVFTEAQLFKNKYCPRLPAFSHFYPFLMKLNAIWNRKLEQRLRVLRKELQAALKRKNKQKLLRNVSEWPVLDRRRYTSRAGNSMCRTQVRSEYQGGGVYNIRDRQGYQCRSSSKGDQRTRTRQVGSRTVLLGISRNLNSLYDEHSRLRREVRLHITSRRSLELFGYYDQLVKFARSTIEELGKLHEQTDRNEWELHHHSIPSGNSSNESGASEKSCVIDVPRLPAAPSTQGQGKLSDRSKHKVAEFPDELAGVSKSVEGINEATVQGSTIAQEASSITPLEQKAIKSEAMREQLHCIVQDTCDHLGGITNSAFTRIMACCLDLEKLMRMIQYRYIPKLYNSEIISQALVRGAQQAKAPAKRTPADLQRKKADASLSNTPLSSPSHSSEASDATSPHAEHSKTAGLPAKSSHDAGQDFCSALHSQYAQPSAAARLLKKYGQPNRNVSSLEGNERAKFNVGGSQATEALSQVVASVLDFTSEVKYDIQSTQHILEKALNQALSLGQNYSYK